MLLDLKLLSVVLLTSLLGLGCGNKYKRNNDLEYNDDNNNEDTTTFDYFKDADNSYLTTLQYSDQTEYGDKGTNVNYDNTTPSDQKDKNSENKYSKQPEEGQDSEQKTENPNPEYPTPKDPTTSTEPSGGYLDDACCEKGNCPDHSTPPKLPKVVCEEENSSLHNITNDGCQFMCVRSSICKVGPNRNASNGLSCVSSDGHSPDEEMCLGGRCVSKRFALNCLKAFKNNVALISMRKESCNMICTAKSGEEKTYQQDNGNPCPDGTCQNGTCIPKSEKLEYNQNNVETDGSDDYEWK